MPNILSKDNKWSYFDGTTSYIRYDHNSAFNFFDGVNDIPFEIEFDILFYSIAGNPWIMGLQYLPAQWLITLNGGSLYVLLYSTDNANYLRVNTSVNPATNTLYHFKIIYDGSCSYNGINIYVNGSNVTTNRTMVGTYTTMAITTGYLDIGRRWAGTSFFEGCLRNIKIRKNGELTFFVPMQDASNISKDIIGGLVATTVNSVIVDDIDEGGKWAYFNGSTSYATIGTTSTLGWMNSGVFNIQFDVKKDVLVGVNSALVCTATNWWQYGFLLNLRSSTGGNTLGIYNGSGVASIIIYYTTLINGTSYHFLIQGNGTQVRLLIINNDTGIVHYDSGYLNCSYIPNATTAYNLRFSVASAGWYSNNYIKNFIIYTDTAGTVPFLSLPFQTENELNVDTVGGLVGTLTDVSLIDYNRNILRHKNLAIDFSSTESTQNYIGNIGSPSDFSYLHRTGKFIIEFDLFFRSIANVQEIFYTAANTSLIGINIYIASSDNKLTFVISNGTDYPTVTAYSPILIAGQLNKIRIVGDGTNIVIFRNGIAGSKYGIGGLPYYETGANSAVIGQATVGYKTYSYIRNLNFYDESRNMLYSFPLYDPNDYGKEVIQGKDGTVFGTLLSKNISEDKRWAYFNGTSSRLTIGNFNTLDWMFAGVFKIEFTAIFLSTALLSNHGYIGTGYDNNQRGFSFRQNSAYASIGFAWVDKSTGGWKVQAYPSYPMVYGAIYRYVVTANGTTLRYIVYNEDNTIFYDSGDVYPLNGFVPQVGSTFQLQFSGGVNPQYLDGYVRDFTIYSDTEGTIPFLSLPFQDETKLETDVIGNLKGTSVDLHAVDNTQTVLAKKQNLIGKFGTAPSTYGYIYNLGTFSTFNYIHQTGIFKIELEYYAGEDTGVGGKYMFNTRSSSGTANGFAVLRPDGSSSGLTFYMGSGDSTILAQSIGNIFMDGNVIYKLIIVGDGAGITLTKVVDRVSTTYTKINYTSTPTPSGDAQMAGRIGVGGGTAGSCFRNLKIYDNNDVLRNFFPLTDVSNLGRDIVGNISSGSVTNVSTIDLN